MAITGPIPKRQDQLSHPMTRRPKDERSEVTKGALRPVDEDMVQPNPDWEHLPRMAWDAALSSGQADYYQNSDLVMLYIACEELDQIIRQRGRWVTDSVTGERYWIPPKRPAIHVKTILDLFASLLMTEGDRRRVRLELEAPKVDTEDAQVLSLVKDMKAHIKG